MHLGLPQDPPRATQGPAARRTATRIVLAHAQDIDGSPLQHEIVCWSATTGPRAHHGLPERPGRRHRRLLLPDGTPVGPLVAHIDQRPGAGSATSSTHTAAVLHDDRRQRQHGDRVQRLRGGTVNVVASFVQRAHHPRHHRRLQRGGAGELVRAGPITTSRPRPRSRPALPPRGGAIAVGPVLVDGHDRQDARSSSRPSSRRPCTRSAGPRVKPFGGKRVLQVRVNGKNGMAACSNHHQARQEDHRTSASSSPTRRSQSRTFRSRRRRRR